jgi:hypothetical protein
VWTFQRFLLTRGAVTPVPIPEESIAVRQRIIIEPLESRIAPAGLVSVKINSITGEISLQGDEEDNSVRISQTGPTSVRIEGLDGTLLGDAALLDIAKVSSISGSFGEGNDTIALMNVSIRALDLGLGGGADSLGAENLSVRGEAKIDFGAGGGAAKFAGSTTSLGSLLIVGEAGDASVSLDAAETKIKGGLEFDGGSSADSLTGDVSTALTIGKGIYFDGNGGIDRLDFVGPGATKIGKSGFGQSLLYSGWDSSEVSVQIRTSRVTLAGEVSVGNAMNSNYLRLGDPLGIVKVGTVSDPQGISFWAGDGDSNFQLFGETVAVAGSIYVSGGTGATKLEALDVGKLTIGRDRIGDSIEVYGGSGADEIRLRGREILIAGGVDTSGRGGMNTLAIEGENVSIGRTRGGISMFVSALGDVVDAERVELKGARVTVKGTMYLDGGEDADVLDLTGIGVLTLHSISFTGHDGDDQVLIGADRMKVSKKVGLHMDDGNDRVEISADGRINGNLVISLNEGNTQRADVSGRLATLQVVGELHITSFDSDFFRAKSTDTIALRNVTAGQSCYMLPGGGNSQVSIDNFFARAGLFIGMSGGNDRVEIETGDGVGPSVFRGTARISLGDGDDILRIGDSTPGGSPADHHARFFRAVEIDGGPGTNVVNADVHTANYFARVPEIVWF